jgi:hypothetical protein
MMSMQFKAYLRIFQANVCTLSFCGSPWYTQGGYTPITLQFDPFALTKLQKDSVKGYLNCDLQPGKNRFHGNIMVIDWQLRFDVSKPDVELLARGTSSD